MKYAAILAVGATCTGDVFFEVEWDGLHSWFLLFGTLGCQYLTLIDWFLQIAEADWKVLHK